MNERRFTLIEDELRHAHRVARATHAGVRTMALSLALPVLVLLAAAALFHAGSRARDLDALLCGVGVVWLLVLLRIGWLWLARLWLVRTGRPAHAVVVYKEPLGDGAARFYAWYTAGRAQWGVGWTSAAEDAEIGDAVTVLHAADDPARSVAYRWAGFTAVTRP